MDFQARSRSEFVLRIEMTAWVLNSTDAGGETKMRAKTLVPLFLLIVPQFLKSGLRMKQSLDVPVGLVYLQAGVIDPNSGHTGATEFPLDVKPSL
jgi:hypothetical protein